jgi:RHS repeat-associated protein
VPNSSNKTCATPNATYTSTYVYNGDGLRVADTPAGGSLQQFTWDTTSSLPRIIRDGTNEYLYGPDSVTPIEQINMSTGSVSYLVSDNQGVRMGFASNGTSLGEESYNSYGVMSGSTDSPFGFSGAYTDTTGLLYLIHRYYDATTQQFLNVDMDLTQTEQPYIYAGGDPVNASDPTGMYTAYCSPQDCPDRPGTDIPVNLGLTNAPCPGASGGPTSVSTTQVQNLFQSAIPAALHAEMQQIAVDEYVAGGSNSGLDASERDFLSQEHECQFAPASCWAAVAIAFGASADSANALATNLCAEDNGMCDDGAVYPDALGDFIQDTIVTLGVGGLAKAGLDAAIAAFSDDATDATLQTTIHGAQQLAARGFTAARIASTLGGESFNQADGALVFLNQISPGKFDFIVLGDNGVVTAGSNWGTKAVARLAANYGWNWSPP